MASMKKVKLYAAHKEALEGKLSFKESKEKIQDLIDLIDWGRMKRGHYDNY